VYWFAGDDDLTGAVHHPVVATISTILSFNKIQNGNILVLNNTGPSGKMDVKTKREIGRERERERERERCQFI